MDRRWNRLSRRQFVVGTAGLGLLAGCGRWPGQTQPVPRVPIIGYINGTRSAYSESSDTPDPVTAEQVVAFRQGLAERGYVEGQNILVDYRFTDWSAAAVDLARRKVTVIVAQGSGATLAARAATSTIPIVFSGTGDPVGRGLVASLARPGGNVTGLANFAVELSGKRLELLRQVVPGLRRIAFLCDATLTGDFLPAMQAAAEALGLQVLLLEVQDIADFEAAFEVAITNHADALITSPGRILRYRTHVVRLAAGSRLPAIYSNKNMVRAGGLMGYGPNELDLQRRAAYYVDRVLKGAKPADLPVEQPMTFDFVVNLKTARELGITFPNEIMLQVTEVIQ